MIAKCIDTSQACIVCRKSYDKTEFVGVRKQPVVTCSSCRNKDKIRDAKRKGRVRDYKEYDARPERIAKKQKWNAENRDKLRGYWRAYRQRRINQDLDGYLKRNAENMRNYRQKHPDKIQLSAEKQKMNPLTKYKTYVNSAKKRGIPFDLTPEQCQILFNDPCVYCCNQINDTNLNGIDRFQNDQGYTIENCVSCCEMCNFLKGQLDPETFIEICEHIGTYVGQIQGDVYDKFTQTEFGSKASNYLAYKDRANDKGLIFELTIDDYHQIISKACYLCGIQTDSINHINGIDRINSQDGYTIDNCRTCCAGCNYFKNSYTYESFIGQLVKIYHHNTIAERLIDNPNQDELEIETDLTLNYRTLKQTGSIWTKMTPDELTENTRLRRLQSRENLIKRYNPD